jgi:hypothetical protein
VPLIVATAERPQHPTELTDFHSSVLRASFDEQPLTAMAVMVSNDLQACRGGRRQQWFVGGEVHVALDG